MKRGALILILGVALAAVGYWVIYHTCTASVRTLQRSNKPELAWLKEEFNLSDAEFARVSELHTAYLPRCREMCLRIDAQSARVQRLLAGATRTTPEMEAALVEAAQLRVQCQQMMLRHFFQVSQTMPPEQGRRYLDWVESKAFLPNYGMNSQPLAGVTGNEAANR